MELYMLKHSRNILDPIQSHLQFGFTCHSSPVFAALALTEILADAADEGEPRLVTFMDTSKAFDVVSHHSMLNSMNEQGVKGTLWSLYESMYSGIKSVVQWNGELSEPFTEKQGIRQGGCSSADAYKTGKNRLLARLDADTECRLGCIKTGALMVADDLAIISKDEEDLQHCIKIAEHDAAQERYCFNTDKTKVVPIKCRSNPQITLNDATLGCSPSEVHLGIARNKCNNNMNTVLDRIKSARRAAYSLMGAGMHGLNGTGPEVALIQYSTYVLPTLLYGLEALNINEAETNILAAFHRKNIRCLLHLPKSTAIPALYLLSGMLPIEALIHTRILLLFRSITSGNASILPVAYIQEIITRQLAMKDLDSRSWCTIVKKLLTQYDLPPASTILERKPRKIEWTAMVNRAIRGWWTKELRKEAGKKSSLQLINLDKCAAGSIHPMLSSVASPLEIRRATVKLQLLVQRYPLATCHVAGQRKTEICPLCHNEEETTSHFLLRCSNLKATRDRYLPSMLTSLRKQHISIDPDNLTKILLDSNYIHQEHQQEHEIHSRNLIFRLHHDRSLSLGGDSEFKRICGGAARRR